MYPLVFLCVLLKVLRKSSVEWTRRPEIFFFLSRAVRSRRNPSLCGRSLMKKSRISPKELLLKPQAIGKQSVAKASEY